MSEQQMPARIWVEDTREYGAWFVYPKDTCPIEFVRSDIAERMAEALEDWLNYAEDNLSEFDQPGECSPDDGMCPRCRSNGCIKMKFDAARSALSAFKDASR